MERVRVAFWREWARAWRATSGPSDNNLINTLSLNMFALAAYIYYVFFPSLVHDCAQKRGGNQFISICISHNSINVA